ncbi:BTAD domain-containing putative transcriptional regulator [Streptomyces phaeochromogenes]|uniref:AfsR/SARP family transcriptional regulator n=1 Tax=Streptomyces phaeochromogenes TaxID=1923 RepID=UPI00386E624A|nr:winged helix-turn-helix domain-containing protein [Streptomyces phaeochromogenes]
MVVHLRLLGPVEFAERGRAREVGPPQRRAVLAALAVDTALPVAADVLVQRVWGTDSPDGARRALHAHITRIRRLRETTGDADNVRFRLVRRSGGYLLDADPDRVDILRFRHLVNQAREAGRSDKERMSLLSEALGLWRGEPLAGLSGQWAARVREAWRRQHVDAAVEWAQLELRAGGTVTVIGLLSDLLGECPMAESLTEVLMRALHAADRDAEALGCYAALRQRLAEDSAPTPGPASRAYTRPSCGEPCHSTAPGRRTTGRTNPPPPPRYPPPPRHPPPRRHPTPRPTGSTSTGRRQPRGRVGCPRNCPWAYAVSPEGRRSSPTSTKCSPRRPTSRPPS